MSPEHAGDDRPLFAYSLTPSITLDAMIAVLAFGYGLYVIAWTGGAPYSWVMSVLGFGDAYLRLWNRRIRQARFYKDHFEINGRGIRLNTTYDLIRDLDCYKQLVGDFRSDGRVSIMVEGNADFLVMPNRKNRKLKLDLCSFLSEKAKK